MLGWLFRPSCPCDASAKNWIEERLEWLAVEFNDSAFTGRTVVLPTPEFFPDPYDSSKKAVRMLLDRVCGYMDMVPELVALKFIKNKTSIYLVNEDGHAIPDAAGTYHEGRNKFVIRIDQSGMEDQMSLVGTIAHELAHVRLLGESRIMRDVFDNELLTDLTVVHFGLGIFLANAPRHWDAHYTKWPDTDLKKPEYMTPPMFGWALAHIAWFRDDHKPGWARHLNSSARTNMMQGLRYLNATNDSWYRPARVRKKR